MPGIVGIADPASEIDGDLLESMVQSVKHEPWYIIDNLVEDHFAISRVHLGIINPERQPIYNEDKSLCIFFDGEIFDYEYESEYLKLKGHKFEIDNDSEFCLHLYEELGLNFVKKLEGSFVAIIIDIYKKILFIVNDRYGLRPLYYLSFDGRLIFASEVKAIIQDNRFKKEVNNEAVSEFFTFGHLLGDKTFFEGIKLLPPASTLIYQDGSILIDTYWEFRYEENDQMYDEDHLANELVKLFSQAVQRRLSGKQKIAVPLSGGLDSRSVVAAVNAKCDTISTITFKFDGIDNTPEIAENVSKKKGFVNVVLDIKKDFIVDYGKSAVYLTDGMLNLVHFHQISILNKIKEYADIVLVAFAFDALLGGSYLNKKILSAKTDEELIDIIYERDSIGDVLLSSLFITEWHNKIKDLALISLKHEFDSCYSDKNGNKADTILFRNHVRRSSLTANMVYQRSILEDRVPTYDNDLVNFILKLPPELRYNHGIYLKFLKKLSPEMAKIKNNHTDVRADLPAGVARIFALKKNGIRNLRSSLRIKTRGTVKIPFRDDYPDYGEWIRTEDKLRKWVEEILLDEKTLSREYFNNDFICKLVHDHMNYREDNTQIIFRLLTFELWNRLFMDDEV
jgi:asparagine synthase (glutamine-hydrolysing)